MRQKGFAPILIVAFLTIVGVTLALYKNIDNIKSIIFVKLQSKVADTPNTYLDQANSSLSWGNGKLIKTAEAEYSSKNEGIESALIEGKNIVIRTFSYKGKIIVNKSVAIDDYTTLSIWQYISPYNPEEGIIDFSIFDGYENNTLSATPVINIVNGWSDSYKTKNNIDMYYQYFFTPKSIGTIALSSFWTYFPNVEGSKPSLVTIYFSGVNGFATDPNDPAIAEAKTKINQIADTFKIGRLE